MNAFYLIFVFLFAAVVSVPIAKRLGLGSVLGYLLAGVAIGPYVLRLVGDETGEILHVAEFGVVMMLFVIGLELRPSLLWELRRPILGMGGVQVLGTAVVTCGVGLLLGAGWKTAFAVGLILAMSSTAIVLQSLSEKGLMKTPGGQASFSVLLFQDISVIPILAGMPLLATLPKPAAAAGGGHDGGMEGLGAWQHALLVLGAITVLILAGRFLVRPFFRFIASSGLREMFTTATLLLVLGVVMLMQKAGLSPALGTFLAGVLLAESEYRVQLETDIEPFKGLFLGMFFIGVGASIDFSLMAKQPGTIALMVLGLLVVKFVVLLATGRAFRLDASQSLLFAFALAQGGEFAFVLFSLATNEGVLAADTANLLIASVAVSMAAAPLMLTVYDKLVLPRFKVSSGPKREHDKIDESGHSVILAGFGRLGHVVGRLVRANGFDLTVLDHDPDQVDTLRKFGMKCFYGDASRLDLLHAAGAEKAKLLVIAIDDEVKTKHIIEIAQRHFPHLKLLVRASSRQNAYELYRLGLGAVFRETFGSALDMGQAALIELGVTEQRARRAADLFRKHDEESVREMSKLSETAEEYFSLGKQHHENLVRALQSDEGMLEEPPDSSHRHPR